jgi:sulfonate transport system permease protein
MRKILLRRSNRSSIGRAPTDMAGLVGRRRAARWRRLRAIVVELVCLLLLWELLGVTIGGRSHILPTPINVAQVMWSDRSVLATALRTTSGEALWGFVVGNAVAIILGVLSVTSRRVASVVVQLGVVSYCLPIVAVGPILIILLSGALPQEVLAGIAVVFTTLVLTVEGLQSASVRQREVINAFGGTSFALVRKVLIRSSVPYIFRGLKIAAPASILGAIIGEFLSGTGGVGVVMAQASQSLEVSLTWAAAVVATAAAAIGYAVIGVVGRAVSPWAREVGLS